MGRAVRSRGPAVQLGTATLAGRIQPRFVIERAGPVFSDCRRGLDMAAVTVVSPLMLTPDDDRLE